jgi:hypothetical protein
VRHCFRLDRRDLLGLAGLDPLRREGVDRRRELVLVGVGLPRVVMSPISFVAIFNSPSFSLPLPAAGKSRASRGRISLAQRIVLSIRASPSATSAASAPWCA